MTATLTRFLGDGDHAFALPPAQLLELERLTGRGIGVLCRDVFAGAFGFRDVTETVRLALIGGGMDPEAAFDLTDQYVSRRPIAEGYALAVAILDAAFNGAPEPAEHPVDATPSPILEAAIAGDLGAALTMEAPAA